jgi:dolichol kinase
MISQVELRRKLIHLFNLVIPFSYMFIFQNKNQMAIIMLIFALIFVIVDLTRMRLAFVKKIFNQFFNSMMREHEISGHFTGATWVLIISVPVIFFLPKEIAILSLVFMSLGDIAAAIVGLSFGKTKMGNKSLEGSIGCLSICIFSAHLLDLVPWIVSMSGAVMATVFEALPIDIDDNVLIPIGAGLTMVLVSLFIA